MLSVSDLMVALFSQNLQTISLFEKSWSILDIYSFVTEFSVHSSTYTMAIIGIDCYFRIKHYANYKTFWARRVELVFVSIAVFLAFIQAIMTLVGLLPQK